MLAELLAFFDGSFPAAHPYSQIEAVPGRGEKPELWLLGSSTSSAEIAGVLGLPFAFAHHFSPANTLPAVAAYRERFRASPVLEAPYVMIAAAVMCADADDEARDLHGSTELYTLRLSRGSLGRVPSPDEAASYLYTETERQFLSGIAGLTLWGTLRLCGDWPRPISSCSGTEADEIMLASGGWDHAARLHSYELVAELAGLSA